MRVFLHVCCAPDLAVSYEKLIANGLDPVLYFYNPNIYPTDEYVKRLNEVKKLSEIWQLELIEENYDPNDFLDKIKPVKNEKSKRCYECMKLRLEKTKVEAKKRNFEIFSTTLLSSPRKSHHDIQSIAKKLEENDLTFKYINFRSNNGGKIGANICKTYNIYRQKYCGCSFSLNESQKYEEISKENNLKNLSNLLGESTAKIWFEFYKTDLLRIPEDVPAYLIEKTDLKILQYLKPQIVLIKKDIAKDIGILNNSRFKVGRWKGKAIIW